ncbi:hypothetical protein AWE51_22330 [Aquimarina aggregata]|uniref:Oligosaccharide repeat unit polymerase n=1 Tax=Aquimarina aggregata TaxID=1642818 RepID=A0A163BIU6_9FLAO|nr:O-antigen polymerase [Aquimarina aggregata]KZS41443.1 hypothetical protein AWE51_22330 [Aquimarina aggregata]
MNYINKSFLLKLSPYKITVYGIVFWLFLFITTSFKVNHNLDFLSIFFIVINYIFFFLGYFLFKTDSVSINNEKLFFYDQNILKKVLKVVLIIAIFGLLLKFFDKFYLREISISNSVSDNRMLLSQKGPSIISIISAIINPFSFLPLFLYYSIGEKRIKLYIICLFLFLVTIYEFLSTGSRSGIFVVILLLVIYLRYFKKIRLNLKQILLIGTGIFLLGIYSFNMFIDRTKEYTITRDRAVKHILTNAGYNFTLQPKEEAVERIVHTKNELSQSLKTFSLNFVQYYIHGVYEFSFLRKNYKEKFHFGAYTFNILAKFSNIIFRTNFDLKKIQNSPPRIAVYITFFGPLYVDFGWFSIFFMFFLGVYQKNVFKKILKGKVQYLPLFFYFLVINFFMLVVNFIVVAQGIYNIVAFLLFAWFFRILTSKIILKHKGGGYKYFRIIK